MVKILSYELEDGTVLQNCPTDPDIHYDTYVSIVPDPGYILRHKYTRRKAEAVKVLLGLDHMWKEIPLA